MVKKIFFIILCTCSLIAGEFTASVSSTQASISESFSLTLTLKDTSPKEAPNISPLKQHFVIHSQQHSTNTTIINGKTSSNISWKLSLTPKMEGTINIPSITINTTEGLLSTQPIQLKVTRGKSQDNIGPNVIIKVSNASPYKNEPLIYTAVLTSKTPLHNIHTQKMQVDDAIVDLVDEPKIQERVIDGVSMNVVEFTYLITPLKPGTLTIPPITIQGTIPIPQKRKNPFSSFFSDDLDSFGFMSGFGSMQPFAITTEEIELDVQPAIPEISPWLPAKTLTLEEEWESNQTLRVGEPFSRSLVIKAEGLKASQLPHLEDLCHNTTCKIYADKPSDEETISGGSLHSVRKEQHTIIPSKAGTLVLPAISINWWDSAKKEKRTSTIPARTIQVLPALNAAPDSLAPSEEIVSTPETTLTIPPTRPPFLLYGIIGILTFFLASALLWGFTLQRKIASLTNDPLPKPKPKKSTPPPAVIQKEKKETLPALNPT